MATFNDIYNSMVTYLQNAKSKISDFTSTSVVGQILSSVASVIDEIYYSITTAQNQAYITTATDAGLDNKGADVGVTRKQATAAQWYFTFTKNQASTQQITIPQGTVITTIPQPGQNPVTFATDMASYLPAGTLTVTVSATCQQSGSVGNIAMNTSLLIGSATPGIDGVQLNSLSNGVYGNDVETDDDYRNRILSALVSKAQGTVAWYKETALSVTGVQNVLVKPLGRGPGTVDIYIVGTGNSLPSTNLINSVQSTIDAGRVITDDAKVFAPSTVSVNETVSIKVAIGYDLTATGNAVQTAITNLINNLGIGGGTAGALYQSSVISAVMGVTGVLNVTTTNTDVTFISFQLPQAGTITVNTSN